MLSVYLFDTETAENLQGKCYLRILRVHRIAYGEDHGEAAIGDCAFGEFDECVADSGYRCQ